MIEFVIKFNRNRLKKSKVTSLRSWVSNFLYYWTFESSSRDFIQNSILTWFVIKYSDEFMNWIAISRNQRRCSFSLWPLYNRIFSDRNVLTFEMTFIIVDNPSHKNVASITIAKKIKFRNVVFLICNSISFWFIFKRRFFVLILVMSCYIWLFDIRDNVWFFCVDFVIRIEGLDFEAFELLSNSYEI